MKKPINLKLMPNYKITVTDEEGNQLVEVVAQKYELLVDSNGQFGRLSSVNSLLFELGMIEFARDQIAGQQMKEQLKT